MLRLFFPSRRHLLPASRLRGRGISFCLPSPPLRGRGVGGEGGLAPARTNPLTPDPSPPGYRGRGGQESDPARTQGRGVGIFSAALVLAGLLAAATGAPAQ